jgi:hypothetical protein
MKTDYDGTGWGGHSRDAANTMAFIDKLAAAAVLLARQARSGSAALQQYHSFQASLMKLVACPASFTGFGRTKVFLSLGPMCLEAAKASVALLLYAAVRTGVDWRLEMGRVVSSRSTGSAAGSRSLPPALVVVGRFFLQAVQQLQLSAGTDMQSRLISEYFEGPRSVSAMAGIGQLWLEQYRAPLGAAGYALEPILQQLQQLQSALHSVESGGAAPSTSFTEQSTALHSSSSSSSGGDSAAASSSTRTDEVLSAALQQLEQAGSALCCMAVPCMCNNPACTNTSGPTELSLVSGRSCVCAGCRVSHYCCRSCQT